MLLAPNTPCCWYAWHSTKVVVEDRLYCSCTKARYSSTHLTGVFLAAIAGVFGDVVEIGAPVGADMAALGAGKGILARTPVHRLVDVQLLLRRKQLPADL